MRYLLIATITILFSSCNKGLDKESNQKIEINIDKQFYSGQIIEFYKNGVRKYLVNYKNGVKNGDYERWFKSGNKKVEGRYKNNNRIGTWNWYNEKGVAYFAIEYKDVKLSTL